MCLMNDGPSDKTENDGQNLAVLFADIDGSTKLYEVHGDETAHRLTAECLTVLDVQAGIAGGRVVKTSGDGVMCVFGTPDEAFRAATAMRDAQKSGKVSIHAGFHFGPVIEDSGDFYGDTVNVAARVTDLAKAGEILMTEDTVVRLSPPFRSSTRWLDKAAMKGKKDPVAIYEVVVEDEQSTVIRGPLLAADSDKNALLTSMPALYFYGALVEAFGYIRNAERAGDALQRYVSASAGVGLTEQRGRVGGALLAPRIEGAAP